MRGNKSLASKNIDEREIGFFCSRVNYFVLNDVVRKYSDGAPKKLLLYNEGALRSGPGLIEHVAIVFPWPIPGVPLSGAICCGA